MPVLPVHMLGTARPGHRCGLQTALGIEVRREVQAGLQQRWPELGITSDDGVSSEASHTVGLCPALGKDKPQAS